MEFFFKGVSPLKLHRRANTIHSICTYIFYDGNLKHYMNYTLIAGDDEPLIFICLQLPCTVRHTAVDALFAVTYLQAGALV